jgi:hypothetical protein
MIKWAEGWITSRNMDVTACEDPNPAEELRYVLRYAFRQAHRDERMEDFHGAEVHLPFFKHARTRLGTIGDLIKD